VTTVRGQATPLKQGGLAGRIPSPGFETFGSVFGFIYTFLAGNVLLALANAPLVLCLALVADPIAAWPFFLALSVTVPPSLAGLFASFQALNDDGGAVKPVAAFLRGYRRGFRRAARLGLAAVVTVSMAVMAVAGVVLLPEAGLKSLLKASLYLSIQRWYLSLAMLVLLGIIASAALLQPVLGVALVPAPLLFVVWSNAAYAIHTALRTP
jgi:hypothetical protein